MGEGVERRATSTSRVRSSRAAAFCRPAPPLCKGSNFVKGLKMVLEDRKRRQRSGSKKYDRVT